MLPAARPQRRRKGRRASCAFVDRRKFLHERHYPPQPCQNRPAPDSENPLPSATHWRPDNRYRENPAGWKSSRRSALPPPWQKELDRKSVVAGKSVSLHVDLGGRRIIKKKNNIKDVEYEYKDIDQK